MDLLELLRNLFFDYTLRTVALGAAVLGIVSGSLGAFAVLRKQSLVGDAISHAALPGVVLAFLLTRSKAPLVLVLGAMIAGWLGTLWMLSIIRNSRIKADSALGLVLSVFFGIGMVLLTFTQRLPDARQAGLSNFLFGQAAALLESDVITMGIIGGLALLVVALLWKEFKLLSFDPEYAATLGLPIGRLDVLITTLLVVAIVLGLQAVGVVLMSAMLVAPAAAARQWTDRLSVMVLLSAAFGATAGVIGTMISSTGAGLATGPTIVLVASVIVLVSMLFSPHRGLLPAAVRRSRQRSAMKSDQVLESLWVMAAQHANPQHPHAAAALLSTSHYPESVRYSLRELERRGLVNAVDDDQWALTAQGVTEAQSRFAERRDA